MRRWNEVIDTYPVAHDETARAEAEAVIGDGTQRYGGWLAVSDDALYIGRQGKLGMCGTRRIDRIPLTDIIESSWRPSSEPGVTEDFILTTTGGSFAMYLRNGRQLIDVVASNEQIGANTQIRELQGLYANRVSFGVTMLSEMEGINHIYGMLRDLGADADQTLVDRRKVENAEWRRANSCGRRTTSLTSGGSGSTPSDRTGGQRLVQPRLHLT